MIISEQGYQLAPATLYYYLQNHYTDRYEKRDRSFGNAGMVRTDMLEAIKNTDRIAKLSKEERNQIHKYEIIVDDLHHLLKD